VLIRRPHHREKSRLLLSVARDSASVQPSPLLHQADRATPLLWVAHNLERAADRVTSIRERVVFTATGEMNELDVKEPPE
jgi:phosphate uptake regulator